MKIKSSTVNSFINTGDITADTLSLSVAGDFDYGSDFQNNGNIDATNQNFIVRNGDFTNNTSIALAGNLGITANDFFNSGGSITADTFAVIPRLPANAMLVLLVKSPFLTIKFWFVASIFPLF